MLTSIFLSLFFKAFGEQVQSYRESNVGVLDEVNRNIRFEIPIATDRAMMARNIFGLIKYIAT